MVTGMIFSHVDDMVNPVKNRDWVKALYKKLTTFLNPPTSTLLNPSDS